MHFSTLIVPLTLALGAVCDPLLPSRSLPLDHARRQLQARTDVSPEKACGQNPVDCGNGWCCTEGSTCGGTLEGIPLCGGTEPAIPYKNIEEVYASLTSVIAGFGVTDLPDLSSIMAEASQITDGGAVSSFVNSAKSEASSFVNSAESKASSFANSVQSEASSFANSVQSTVANLATQTSAPAEPKSTGGAARGMVAAWGAAAVGGAGLLLI